MHRFTLHCVKSVIIVLAFCGAVAANPVSYTYTTTNFESEVPQVCGFAGCPPDELALPQFNPVFGTLESISYTFTDYQTAYGGLFDLGAPITDSFSYSETEGDVSSQLGINVHSTQNITCGPPDCTGDDDIIGLTPWISNTFMSSGTLSGADMDMFIGTGYALMSVTPYLDSPGGFESSSGYLDVAFLNAVFDSDTLTVTYNVSTVPEPRDSLLVLAVVFAAALWLKTLFRFPS
jgi:hypothetical protein